MDKKDITARLRSDVFPILKDLGFTKRDGLRMWRHGADRIDICTFHFIPQDIVDVMQISPLALGCELGVFFPFVPRNPNIPIREKSGQLLPKEYDAHIRGNLAHQMDIQHRADIWEFDISGRDCDMVLANLAATVTRDAATWFARSDDLTGVLDHVLHRDEEELIPGVWHYASFGTIGSPMRNLLAAGLALELGAKDIARDQLDRALKDDWPSDLDAQLAQHRAALDQT